MFYNIKTVFKSYSNLVNRHNIHLIRNLSSRPNKSDSQRLKTKSTLYYLSAAGVLAIGLSYAAVPLYRMFCQAYSYGGTVITAHDSSKIENMQAVKNRELTIKFNADTAASMRWNFKPQQNEIKVKI